MIDSLGGILTKGLLGNSSSLVLGFFNLGFFEISVVITPDYHPQGLPGFHRNDEIDEVNDKYLSIVIRIKDQKINKIYKISNNQANVLIKINKSVKTIFNNTNIVINKLVLKPIKNILKINIKRPFK